MDVGGFRQKAGHLSSEIRGALPGRRCHERDI